MQELRQSTEMKVRVGSAVDATDGVSPETGLTLGAADQAELLKHNGAATVDISGATFAAVTAVDGWYDLTLTTAYTDTLGQLTVVIQDSSLMAPIFRDFMVVTANYWDSKYSTDKLEVDVTSIAANVITATSINADAITAAKIADNAIAGEHLNATACTKIIDDFETQSQADPTGFHVNILEIGGTAQTANDNGADINAILTDTGEIGTAGAGLSDLGGMSIGMKAEVNTEADSALTDYDGPTDTEMIARTLPSADYVVTTDTITGVTTATNLTNAPTNGDLTATMKTSVNTEVSDVIKTDTISEMAQGAPAATPTLEDAIMYLYMYFRNEVTQTATVLSLKNDGGTVITKATVSDDTTTFTKGEMVSGP